MGGRGMVKAMRLLSVPRLQIERTSELPIGFAGHGGGDARPGAIGWFSPR
jgi:hypothetical protein